MAATPKKGNGKETKSKPAAAAVGAGEDSSDEDGEDALRMGPTAFRQRDLVAQAFAGDNVIEVSARSWFSTRLPLSWADLRVLFPTAGLRVRKAPRGGGGRSS